MATVTVQRAAPPPPPALPISSVTIELIDLTEVNDMLYILKYYEQQLYGGRVIGKVNTCGLVTKILEALEPEGNRLYRV